MCPFSSGISLASILLATSDPGRACRLSGGSRKVRARNRMARSRADGSLVAPVRRERPWARFHKHNHPPKRSRTVTGPPRAPTRALPGPPARPQARANARAREPPRNRCSAHQHRGRPLADGNTRAARARVTHLRLTLQLGLVHRCRSPAELKRRARTRTCAYRSPRIDRGRTLLT